MLSPDPSENREPDARDAPVINVRKSEPSSAEDAEFVRSLAQSAFLSYGSYDEYLDGWLRDGAVVTYVAELAGVRAGFFMLTSYRDADAGDKMIADLVAIAVTPASQSKGVGKRMLTRAAAIAVAGDVPAEEMWLVVAEGNSRAQRFFARAGFRLREGVGVYPAGQRALRMVKPLEEEP